MCGKQEVSIYNSRGILIKTIDGDMRNKISINNNFTGGIYIVITETKAGNNISKVVVY